MALNKELGGAFTALVTPFDAEDRVDEKALARIVDAQLARGIDGLVPCGTTGETPALDAAEQEQVVRLVVERVGGKVPVIAGTGSNSTKITVEQTKRALTWGIDAALVVCPYYNKPTQEGLFRHFKAVYEETGAPIVAYNVPGRTVSDLLPETIARLVEAGAIVAVKDATADLARATETLALTKGKKLALLSGDDFTILPFIACGGHGVISVVSNVAPGDTAKLVRECRAGHYAEVRPLHERIVALSRALFLVANPIPVKMAMHLTGWCAPRLRLPLVEADAATTAKIKLALEKYSGGANLEGMMA
ncbi:MAG: 4-hydroxy-tetrahydrodipicolinate synthase [Deltaproteobacteria bacterium]|nr:4-hydroxy-tetrahydrodipicolinate synthase [Deltaproteobacteria bacterium]